MLKKKEMKALASRIRMLKPLRKNTINPAEPTYERAAWAEIVNAITTTAIKEQHLQEFRDIAGWESLTDSNSAIAAMREKAGKEQIGGDSADA